MSDIVQIKTNNDGSLTDIVNNPTLPMDMREAAAAKLGTTVPPPGSVAQEVITDIQDDKPPAEGFIFITQQGTYYKAAQRRSPNDSLIVTPSDVLSTMLDTVSDPDVELTRDAITAYVNAQRGTGG